MTDEILGSIVVKEKGFFKRKRRYHLAFLRDRVMGIIDEYQIADYLDEESGDFDRLEVLEDEDNFEIAYLNIRQVVMKQSGGGSIDFDTWEGTLKFDIEKDQSYRNSVSLVRSAVGEKLIDKSPVQAVKYCPECRDEFQSWVTECPDCRVALVDELPFIQEVVPDPPRSNILSYIDEGAIEGLEHLRLGGKDDLTDDMMIGIAVAPNETVGKMWQGLLEEQGIPSMLNISSQGSHGSTMSPRNSSCEILVMVPEAKRAFTIIQPFFDA